MRRFCGLLLLSFLASWLPVHAQGAQMEVTRQGPGSIRVQGSYDAGDFYLYQGRAVPLRRSLEEILVKFSPETQDQRKAELVRSELSGGEITEIGAGRGRSVSLVRVKKAKQTGDNQQRDKLENGLRRLQGKGEIEYAFAVFIDPVTGSRLLQTDELSVKARPGADVAGLLASRGLEVSQKVRYTDDEYIVRVQNPKAADVIALANELAASGLVQWAEPNFVQEYKKMSAPNDTLFSNQWHLNNTGQAGGTVDADVDAVEAWDLTTGSSRIVIAVLDDGVQTTHPEFSGRIYINEAETINGIDDDGNALIDDRTGWDYYSDDNDPNPAIAYDVHGTAVAGVAAAAGNNGTGVSGACQNCRILPIKICNGNAFASDAVISDAIRYAAQFADVINNSWGGGAASSAIQSAIQYAKANGRGGKGSVVLFASGDTTSGLALYSITIPVGGTHKIRWHYEKNGSLSAGDDTMWLAWVSLPGDTMVNFQSGWPAGSSTSGDAAWSLVDDRLHSDDSHNYTWSAKAGTIGDSQYTDLDLVRTVPGGTLSFSAWVSSEADYDGFRLSIDFFNDGTFEFTWPPTSEAPFSGVPVVDTVIGYPAAYPEPIAVGASTDQDFHSGYSKYGPELDLVAPSSGGSGAGIMTTDRTGADGYASVDYVSGFGGTSASTALASGVVGLVLTRNPDLTADEVQQALQSTADKIGTDPYTLGRNDRYGYGRLNAYSAVLTVGRVDIFFTDPSMGLYQLRTNRNASELDVSAVAGGGASSHAPATAVYRDRQYIAIKGETDPGIYIKSRARDGSFADSSWTQVPGNTSSSPALCVFNDRLYLFVKATSGNGLFYKSMDASGVWSAWASVSGSNTLWRPGLVVSGTHLYCFETDATTNRLFYKVMNDSEVWSSWYMIPTGSTNAAPTPVLHDGSIWLFVKGLAGKLLWWSASAAPETMTSWSPWTSCNGSSEAGPGVAIDPAEKVFHIFVRGNMVPRIWHRTLDPATLGWSDWHLLTNLDPAAQSIDAPAVLPVGW